MKTSGFSGGEFFIDEGGGSVYADGDIGDLTHERYALESMVSEELFNKYQVSDPDSLWALYKAGKMEPEDVADIGTDFLEYMASGGQAKEYMIEKRNWIRSHGTNFEVFTLDADALSRIASFVGEEVWDEDDEDMDADIVVDELSTGRWFEFSVRQLLEANDSGNIAPLLIRHQSPPNKIPPTGQQELPFA